MNVLVDHFYSIKRAKLFQIIVMSVALALNFGSHDLFLAKTIYNPDQPDHFKFLNISIHIMDNN